MAVFPVDFFIITSLEKINIWFVFPMSSNLGRHKEVILFEITEKNFEFYFYFQTASVHFSTCSSGTWKCEVEDMCDKSCPNGLVFKEDVPPCIPTCETHFAEVPEECPYGQ